MLESRLHFSIILLVVSFLLLSLYLVKSDKLNLRYAMLWLIFSFLLLVVALVPGILDVVRKLTGIAVLSNAFFLIGIVLTLLLILFLTVAFSKLNLKNIRLSQLYSISANEIDNLKLEISELKKSIAYNNKASKKTNKT